MLLLHPQVLSGAILLRAMVPLSVVPQVELAGKPVLIISGAQDPIVPAENAATLADLLRASRAAVEHRVLPAGHGLSNTDATMAQQWLRKFTARTNKTAVA
jgi:phospholipase/carboxylesterase